jgi:phosphoribosylformylglycinamidine synthase
MRYRVRIRIMPRAGILDPQGQAVEHALAALGFAEASNVHLGRAIEVDLEAATAGAAESRARAMCDRLLTSDAPGLHFYTLNQAGLTTTIWQRLGLS